MRTLTILLDEDDERSIHEAIARWQNSPTHRRLGGSVLPEGESETAGAILGEICRDWLEQRERLA